ncbi:hypothetical protein BS333_18115 [Vibrio azureus]|uniref:Uncharacterized protein n=1 Tax=Vibrio azureus NBRC 104587 TaxID=1219077 RepID=U3CGK7_9VIBR|nr:hypothetical protein [Vibrio azureus]AUI88259.1 hypothetical protein BS333_18115 [Vibrio azureus]GAD77413.1 hypothetical protein VAZ01S_075_00070 [Vibrio azureus NBRC 104587]
MKSTKKYWNPLAEASGKEWECIEGSDGNLSQITLSEDSVSGDYTRLTRFKDGFYTKALGAKSHIYPEEIFVVIT